MNILVTGGNGQLGNEIRELAGNFPSFNLRFIDIEELDLSSAQDVEKFFSGNRFDLVLHCAAYTAVDKAEDEPLRAMEINAAATGRIASMCSASGTRMVYFSTDYVFNGLNFKPYSEADPADPLSVYGMSKYQGERAVQKEAVAGLILRTSWLYSGFGVNFVKTILARSRQQDLKVVFDQVGSPTYARDLANAVLTLAPKILAMDSMEIFHYSNEGALSWFDFAKAIVEIAGINCQIAPIETRDLNQKAQRPFYSVLNKSKIKTQFGITIPYWKDSLKDCIERLK